VSEQIKNIYPMAVIIGNKTAPRSGAFEIKLKDKLIYSKFKTNRFPTINELKNLIHD
tara:strand:+ start:224 stop:394 length:171 start_codon:yes stop_codon:yes gene_type:complete